MTQKNHQPFTMVFNLIVAVIMSQTTTLVPYNQGINLSPSLPENPHWDIRKPLQNGPDSCALPKCDASRVFEIEILGLDSISRL